jgi:hypothetical protein
VGQSGAVGDRPAEEVDVEDAAQLFELEPLDLGVDRDHHAGDEAVDPAEAVDRCAAEVLGVSVDRGLPHDREPVASGGLDLRDGGAERGAASRRHACSSTGRFTVPSSPRSGCHKRW